MRLTMYLTSKKDALSDLHTLKSAEEVKNWFKWVEKKSR